MHKFSPLDSHILLITIALFGVMCMSFLEYIVGQPSYTDWHLDYFVGLVVGGFVQHLAPRLQPLGRD